MRRQIRRGHALDALARGVQELGDAAGSLAAGGIAPGLRQDQRLRPEEKAASPEAREAPGDEVE